MSDGITGGYSFCTLCGLQMERQLAQRTEERDIEKAGREKAEAGVERLRLLASEIIGAICSGRLASIGSSRSTYVPQIDVAAVKRWSAALEAVEAAKGQP